MSRNFKRVIYHVRWNYHSMWAEFAFDRMQCYVENDAARFEMWNRVCERHLSKQRELTSNFMKGVWSV